VKTQQHDPLYLVIDQGSHATRAFVFDAAGRRISEGWTQVTTARPAPDRVEHDARALLDGTRHAITAAIKDLDRPENLVAAGLATQRSTIVCWDKRSGTPLTPAISWQDTRNQSLISELATGAQRVRQLTGLPLSAHYGASKLRWCLEEIPAVRKALEAKTLAWGPLASYLLYGLLQEKPLICDPANAARTLLWDLRQRDWSNELLGLFELPREPLPLCVHTRASHGHLSIGDRHIPLQLCTGDQSAVPFAAGWPEAERVTVNAGTGAFIQRATPDGPVRSDNLLTGIIYADSHRVAYTLEGTVNGAGAAIEAIAPELGVGPDEVFAELDLSREDVPVFLNGIGGLGSPFWQPGFVSRFVGDGSPARKLQAVLESVLFLIQTNLDELRAASGELSEIALTGGLSREPVFVQGLADLSGLVVLHAEHEEATARGVAFLLNEKVARWPDARGPAVTPRKNLTLARHYQRWQQAMAKALANTRA